MSRLEFFTDSEREVRDEEVARRFGLFTKTLAGCDPTSIAKQRHLNCIVERVLIHYHQRTVFTCQCISPMLPQVGPYVMRELASPSRHSEAQLQRVSLALHRLQRRVTRVLWRRRKTRPRRRPKSPKPRRVPRMLLASEGPPRSYFFHDETMAS